jgi:hypothetical protein
MSATSNHTTTAADNGTCHYWEVRGAHGAVSLALLHSRAPGFALLAGDGGYIARNLAATESGYWVFDVVQGHRDIPFGDSQCDRHHDAGCVVDAFASHLAEPIWARLRDEGVTDARVYAELRALYAIAFDEVTA